MNRIPVLAVILFVAGCYQYDVDTFEKHCERLILTDRGQDQLEFHAPFWAIFPSIAFHSDAIRDDFVAFMNKTHMEKVQNRAPRMAWPEGFEFHLVNLSSFLVIEPNKIIEAWGDGIEKANSNAHKDPADKCLYETVADYFDSMKIHSMESDALGINWKDEVTVIPTDRQARFKKYGWPPP
jgi:hypothetical protein